MKKLLLGGLVVAVAAATGASIMSGRIFQEQVLKLEAEVGKDPRINIVENTINKGLFTSSGSLNISMHLEDGQRLIFESPWQASHLPGWVSYSGETQITLELEGEKVIDLLEEYSMQPLRYQGTAGWNKATTQMLIEPFWYEDALTQIELSGVDLTGEYYYSGRQTGQLVIKQGSVVKNSYSESRLELEELVFTWDQKGEYPWVQGSAQIKADRIYVSSAQGEAEFSQPSFSQNLVFNPQAFDFLMTLDLGKVSNQDEEVGTSKFTLKTEQFNGQAIADLVELLTVNSRFEDASEEDLQSLKQAFGRLLDGSPALVLQEFNLELKSPIKFNQQAKGRLGFDGSNLPLNYLDQLEEGSLDQEDPINRIKLELSLNKLDPGLLMMLGLPASLLNQDEDEQVLVFEAGELKLNGHLLPF